jgi:hypothetical protein
MACDASHIITVLDPNYKLAYVEDRWDTQDIVDGRVHLEAVVSSTCPVILLVLTFIV